MDKLEDFDLDGLEDFALDESTWTYKVSLCSESAGSERFELELASYNNEEAAMDCVKYIQENGGKELIAELKPDVNLPEDGIYLIIESSNENNNLINYYELLK